MTQGFSFLFLVSFLCLESWLSSPLSSFSAAAAAYSAQPDIIYDDGYKMYNQGPPLQYKRTIDGGSSYLGPFEEGVADKRRLRFVRRGMDFTDQLSRSDDSAGQMYLMQRHLRDPRLRFQKREAVFHPGNTVPMSGQGRESYNDGHQDTKEEVKAGKDASGTTTNGSPHSRKRRSSTRLSINNDLQAITDMVLSQEYERRQSELRNLINRMRQAGKRSAPSVLGNDEVTEGIRSEDRTSLKLVKSLKDSLEELLAA